MEQLTLNTELQFRLNTLDIPTHFIEGEPGAYKEGFNVGFPAGAEWQKEQLKAKWEAMGNLMENGLAKDLVNRVAAQLLQD